MGKVFNEQIIKILCAKNRNKVQCGQIGEPNLGPKNSGICRGESYVVFLDKHNRRELQNHIKTLDAVYNPISTESSSNFQPHVQKNVLRQRFRTKRRSFKARLRDGILSVRKFFSCPKEFSQLFSGRRSSITDVKDKEKDESNSSPPVLGPFPDESFCSSLDRLWHCINMLIGHRQRLSQLC